MNAVTRRRARARRTPHPTSPRTHGWPRPDGNQNQPIHRGARRRARGGRAQVPFESAVDRARGCVRGLRSDVDLPRMREGFRTSRRVMRERDRCALVSRALVSRAGARARTVRVSSVGVYDD